jgi:hypothetical protein
VTAVHVGPHRWRLGSLGGTAAPGGTLPQRPAILKFGGSLLSRPNWPAELRDLLAILVRPTTVVVGGGRLVDALRELDATSPRPAALMHRLAIDCMGITARLVASAAGLPLAAVPTRDSQPVVLDALGWLGSAGRADRLPVGWHVTSDSIAGSVAIEHALDLLLAKSVPPPCPADIAGLAARGWVDGHFPLLAADLATLGWAAPDATA